MAVAAIRLRKFFRYARTSCNTSGFSIEATSYALQDAKDGEDVSRHFSYYAWEGGAGSLRWKHEVRQQPFERLVTSCTRRTLWELIQRIRRQLRRSQALMRPTCSQSWGSVLPAAKCKGLSKTAAEAHKLTMLQGNDFHWDGAELAEQLLLQSEPVAPADAPCSVPLQGKDFHRDAAELAEQLIPQHNYRLDAASLAGRHYGQASCREYRGSVLRSMPHRCALSEPENPLSCQRPANHRCVHRHMAAVTDVYAPHAPRIEDYRELTFVQTTIQAL